MFKLCTLLKRPSFLPPLTTQFKCKRPISTLTIPFTPLHNRKWPFNTRFNKLHLSNLPPQSPPSYFNRLQLTSKQYGKPAILLYFVISTIDLGLLFAAVYLGVDVEKIVHQLKGQLNLYFGFNFDTTSPADASDKKSNSLLQTFLVAYGFHKLLLPVRVPITVAITPSFIKLLKKCGWSKWLNKKP